LSDIFGMSQPLPPPISAEEMTALPLEFQALLRRIIDHYERRIATLEAELQTVRKTPQNSSLPPSSQHPHGKPSVPQSKSKKNRGGQPGHPKQERVLVPAHECHQLIVLKPSTCRRCGLVLNGCDPEPLRHQVWEVPQPQPVVTEYQLHRLDCCCGMTTCAVLPEGVPAHTSGPRLVALVGLLMGVFRLSKRRTALALQTLFGVPCSAALIIKLQGHAQQALEPCYQELTAKLPQATVVNLDETALKQGANKAWLWVATTSIFTVFAIRLTRAASVATELLGKDFGGSIVSDRYAGYNAFNTRRQICWAHLKRDFQALIDARGKAEEIGNRLMDHLHEVFRHWHRYRDGTIQRETMRRNIRQRVWSQLWDTLEDGQRCSHAPTAALCRDLFDRFDQLFLFLDQAGVEPTNNMAERALRHFVIWRKLSFGTQSPTGSRFVETMLSVVETCRQQNRSIFDFVTTAVELHFRKQPAPSMVGV
jgi:transposase